MVQHKRYEGFEWVGTNIDVISIHINSPSGYFLEVDPHNPAPLHDIHKNLPLYPGQN